jgi:hypothetical protein
MKMRKAMSVLALVVAAGLVAQTASAQARRGSTAAQAHTTRAVLFGGEVDWATDTDVGVGARAVWTTLGETVGLKGLEGIASFDIFFPGNSINFWEINADVAYPFNIPTAPKISPYFGGGLNVAHSSVTGFGGTTDVGVNLLGGTKFRLGTLSAFGEGRLELHSGSQFVLTFGLLF